MRAAWTGALNKWDTPICFHQLLPWTPIFLFAPPIFLTVYASDSIPCNLCRPRLCRAYFSVQLIKISAVVKSKCAAEKVIWDLRSADILFKNSDLCADYQVLCSCKSSLKYAMRLCMIRSNVYAWIWRVMFRRSINTIKALNSHFCIPNSEGKVHELRAHYCKTSLRFDVKWNKRKREQPSIK